MLFGQIARSKLGACASPGQSEQSKPSTAALLQALRRLHLLNQRRFSFRVRQVPSISPDHREAQGAHVDSVAIRECREGRKLEQQCFWDAEADGVYHRS